MPTGAEGRPSLPVQGRPAAALDRRPGLPRLVGVLAAFAGSAAISYAIVQRGLSDGNSAAEGQERSVTSEDRPLRVDPRHPCGPSCLALASHMCGRPVSLDEVVRATDPDRLGRTSMAELISASSQLGLHAVGVRVAPEAIRGLKLPVILHTRHEHFVVVVSNRAGEFLLLDPPQEPRVARLAELKELCTGRAIILSALRSELDSALAELGLVWTNEAALEVVGGT